jgi:excinuclease ABC subunit B
MSFKLHSPYQPLGDQPRAIEQLVAGVNTGKNHQTLLGVTGSGKTFTMANVIQQTQKPTLIIAHNKTLAAQLYQEFRDFFPENAVNYFVSYYDYYQPEAYIPTTDTYIEKEATINDEIDKLRLAATTNLMTRTDVIIVASVSCIYNLGSPVEYGKYIMELIEGEIISRDVLVTQLSNLQYERSDVEFRRGSFRIRGDIIQLWPAYEDKAVRLDTLENKIVKIDWIDPVTGSVIPSPYQYNNPNSHLSSAKRLILYPAKHYMMNPKTQDQAFKEIETDLNVQLQSFEAQGKIVEAYRLKQKVTHDLEMMHEFGFVNGIENYSRYFDSRKPGDPPFSLLEYFAENVKQFNLDSFLTIVDESHITLPQIRGMHNGDQARKETLINYGFRLPSALDNRPLTFDEFLQHTQQRIYVSATPNPLEISLSSNEVVEQLIRPTGLIDPIVELRPIEGQIEDLVIEVINRKAIGQRTLVTTLTKKMAEALTDYLNDTEKIDELITRRSEKQARKEQEAVEETYWTGEQLPIDQMEVGKIDHQYYALTKNAVRQIEGTSYYPKVAYLHSDVETLERSDILDDLRSGVYDVVVGINLLREGLDLPEVTLVAILDADKEGFLRSVTSLIQTMGRAARHQDGRAILYADNLTKSMKAAIAETQRRRQIQVSYNLAHNISPQTIIKPIREKMIKVEDRQPKKLNRHERWKKAEEEVKEKGLIIKLTKNEQIDLAKIDPTALTPQDKKTLSAKLHRRMAQAARDMDFELATILRDTISMLSN